MAGSTIIQLVLRARDDMSKGLGSATSKITALIAAFAGARAIKETVGQLTELDVAAKRLQITVEDLTAAQYAAFKTSGVGAEQFVDALEEVRIKIEEMNSIQSGGAIDFFQVMRTSSEAFMKLNPLEQLQKISDTMKGISSSPQFTFLDQIGSDNLRNLLPLLEDGSGKFKELMAQAKAAGYPFTPVFQLNEALPASPATLATGPIISGNISRLDNYSTNENREALGILYIDGEGLSYETFTILTSTTAQLKNVRRALFGSTAKAHQAGTKTWAVSEGYGITLGQFTAGSAVYLKTLVKTQTRRQTEPEAIEKTFVVKGLNDQVFPPARVLVNGVEGGEISGVAEVIWRFRSGAAQEVAFYTDDRDQAFSGTVSIGVWSGGAKVEQVDNLTGNSWRVRRRGVQRWRSVAGRAGDQGHHLQRRG